MRKSKHDVLERKGWKVGKAKDFLELTDEEVAFIELKFDLGRKLKDSRTSRNLTQVELARLVSSSQSRVAKMEAGDPTVSIDLLVKSLLAMGVSRTELARALA